MAAWTKNKQHAQLPLEHDADSNVLSDNQRESLLQLLPGHQQEILMLLDQLSKAEQEVTHSFPQTAAFKCGIAAMVAKLLCQTGIIAANHIYNLTSAMSTAGNGGQTCKCRESI